MDINVESSCRICLRNVAVRCIFTLKYEKCFKSDKPTCYEMMKSVLSFTGKEGDRLPDKICKICLSKLSSAYRLKLVSDCSEKMLRDHFFKGEVKTEGEIKQEFEKISSIEELPRLEVMGSNTKIEDEAFADDINHEEGFVSSESDHDNLPLAFICSTKNTDFKIDKKIIKSTASSGATVCSLCGKSPANMSAHLRTHGLQRLACTECKREFQCRSSLRRHAATQHRGDLYYCSLCDKHVKNGNSHRNMVHSSRPKMFSCAVCSKAFLIQSQLNNHRSVHTQEKRFPCSVCGKLFRTNSLSTQHRRKVHEKDKPHICHFCCKAFFTLFTLKEHLRTHTGERMFACSQCPRAFFTRAVLRAHQLRHSAPTRLACTLCPKECTSKGNLKIHMLSHTKEKSHPCKYCGVKFGRTYHRDRHEKTAHEHRLKFR